MSEQTLEQVVQAFALWRQQKTHSHTHIPAELRLQAVNLLAQCSVSKVAKALSLSSAQVNRWRQQQSCSKTEPAQPLQQQSDFLALPLPLNQHNHSSSLELELVLPNACQVRIRGELCAELLRVLLQEARLQ